jgi:hypothetical protein
MKSAFWRSIAVVALVAVPMMANANDATIGSEVAHDAMSGSTLMNTTAIFNAFPHLVVFNGNGVELDADDGDGSGRVWYEAFEGWWTGMTVGRGDLGLQGTNYMWGGNNFTTFVSPDSFFNSYGEGSPFSDAMMLSFGVARPTSGGGAWAANIQLAPFGAENFKTGNPVTTDEEFTKTGFGGMFSWGNGNGLNLSGEFAYQKDEFTDNITATNGGDLTATNFGINARWDRNRWIYQGNFVWLDGTAGSNATGALDETDTAIGFLLNAGRYLKNEVDGQATVELGLNWLSETYDDGSDPAEEEKFSDFSIPTVRVAAWQMISDRFGLMGGVSWGYVFAKFEDDAVTSEDTFSGSGYDWSAGMFFQPNDVVRIDARFEESNLNSILNLGNQNDLVMYLGATIGLN